MTKRKLVLEDGQTFIGEAFGADVREVGEVIFFTGMSGYQEMMTDPSYTGKIVVTTFPSIGAYGVNRDDFEAISPAISGMIVNEVVEEPSNFRSEENLDSYLKRYDIPGISGIDTRMLTKVIREQGTMKGVMTDVTEEVKKSDLPPLPVEADMLPKVSISKPYIIPGGYKRIVVLDLGVKQSLLHALSACHCHITVVPYNCDSTEIARFKPDAVVLSNGPGNPENMPALLKHVQTLKEEFPLFGVGLGYELIALSYGAQVRKLSAGQYGMNIPVTDVEAKKTSFTTMSHDFVIDEATLPVSLTITHRSLSDGEIAGVKHQTDFVSGVQFHPEGAPGSNEMNDIFKQFLSNSVPTKANDGGNQHA